MILYKKPILAQQGLRSTKMDPRYMTKLTPKEELEFKDWYSRLAAYRGHNNDPDNVENYFDARGEWKYRPTERESWFSLPKDAHFLDTYKQPGHPTFSTGSVYSNKYTKGGTWNLDKNGVWFFTHSPYTLKNKDATREYLEGSGEHSIEGNDTIWSIPQMRK